MLVTAYNRLAVEQLIPKHMCCFKGQEILPTETNPHYQGENMAQVSQIIFQAESDKVLTNYPSV